MARDDYNWVVYSSFAGGLNTAQSATKIADDEFAAIDNYEFDLNDVLKARGGFTKYNTSPDFTSRITSLHQFIKSDGSSTLLATSGTELYKDSGVGVFTSIKGALNLPNNTLWQWVNFTDLAIGANRGTGGPDDIVKWNGAGNAAALALTGIAGAPDGAKFVAVWNSRLFVVFSSHPNRLYFSTLGNPEDWSLSGGFIEVGQNDGDFITGIAPHREKFFIFKRNKVYVISAGNPNVDVNQWRLDLFTDKYGCISAFTIQQVLDDLVFLSQEGILSINSVADFGDFKTLVLSRKIKELTQLNYSLDSFVSVLNTTKSVYLLAAPNTPATTINNLIHVMDYKKIDPQVVRAYLFDSVRWSRFTSTIINPSALTLAIISGKKTVFLGGDAPLFYICKWNDDVFSDNGQVINKSFLSKSYNFENLFIRKDWNKAGVNVAFTQDDLSATLEVILNESDTLKNTFSVSLPNTVADSEWDVAIWDVNRFNADVAVDQIIERKIAKFNRAKSAQIKFSNTQVDQDLSIKDIGFEVGLLTQENA